MASELPDAAILASEAALLETCGQRAMARRVATWYVAVRCTRTGNSDAVVYSCDKSCNLRVVSNANELTSDTVHAAVISSFFVPIRSCGLYTYFRRSSLLN